MFEKEAVLFGNADGVLINRAIELFEKKAVNFGSNYSNGWASGFGIGDYTAYYLKFSGFQQAASFANVEEIQRIIKTSRRKENIKS